MKKIVLLGDSIRLGYEAYVRNALADVAEIYSPTNDNCRFAEYMLRYAHEWKANGKWPSDIDVVHWNAGLWDALRLFNDDPMTPPDIYAYYISRIDKRLRLIFPKAKMIFATSTSVDEPWFRGQGYERRNSEIAALNESALRALADTDTIIDDLYTLSLSLPASARSDGTHFNNDEGCRYMGSFVTCALAKAMDIDPSTLPAVDVKAKSIAADILGY